MDPVSAVIITYNEEENIEQCLSAVKEVVEEIIVFDSFSTDKTPQICKQFDKVKFFQVPWEGYAATKNKANQEAKYDYILSVDADEVVSGSLEKSLLEQKEKGLTAAYSFNRCTNYCGKWIKYGGWYPDVKLRLFPKDKAEWQGKFVHEQIKLSPNMEVIHLDGDLLHYSFHNIDEHIATINRFSSLKAKQYQQRNKRFTYLHMIISPLLKFWKILLVKRGFMEGYYGWQIAVLSAFDNLLTYMKLRALED